MRWIRIPFREEKKYSWSLYATGRFMLLMSHLAHMQTSSYDQKMSVYSAKVVK